MFSMVSNWNFISETPPIPPTGLTYGRFVQTRRAGTNLRTIWSNDGISWNLASTPNSLNYYALDFSPEQGLYVCVGLAANAANVISSTNGVTWTSRSKPNAEVSMGVKWCPGFGATGKWLMNTNKNVFTSDDAITWVVAYTYSGTNVSNTFNPDYAVTPAGNYWVASIAPPFGSSGRLKVIHSSNGTTFTESDVSTETIYSADDTRSIKYNKSLNTYLINSSDPTRSVRMHISSTVSSGWTTFTQSVFPSGAQRVGLASSTQSVRYVASAFSSANSTQAVFYSSLGTNGSWTASTMPNVAFLYGAGYAQEIELWYVTAASTNANGYSSPDGITWTSRSDATECTNVIWGAGVRTNGYKQGAGIA